MNKDKAPIHGDGGVRGGGGDVNGLPPQPSRYAAFGASPSLSPSPSSTPPPEYDISGMPEFPPRNPCHRRAHSHFELISLPDDLDLGFPGAGDWPSLSDENDEELLSTFLDVDKLNSSCGASVAESSSAAALALGRDPGPRLRHHHSQSMDMSSSVNAEQLLGLRVTEGMSPAEAKKAMSAAKLAELALVDPKRAKRVWANRQSATRSKERKMRYIAELEWKVQTMRTQTATLSAQLTLLHRDTSGLTAENSELKLRLQNMEQQVHLQDALNDTLKTEVQRLKVATMDNGAVMMNFGGAPHPFGGNQQMFHHNQPIQSMLSAHHLQQRQIHPQHQQPLHPHQPLHPLQAQQLQQAAQDLKMKGPMAAQSQQGDGKSESRGG